MMSNRNLEVYDFFRWFTSSFVCHNFLFNVYLQTKEAANATYDEVNLIQTVSDLFVAGTETTATTLLWALLYMVIYPDIQGKHTQRGSGTLRMIQVQIVVVSVQRKVEELKYESHELHSFVSCCILSNIQANHSSCFSGFFF